MRTAGIPFIRAVGTYHFISIRTCHFVFDSLLPHPSVPFPFRSLAACLFIRNIDVRSKRTMRYDAAP